MTENDYDSFCDVVQGFAELRAKTLSAAAIDLYWRSMQDWSLEDFKSAAGRLLKTCRFMPTPADFEALRRAALPTTGDAWEVARRIARTTHWDNMTRATSGDPVIDAAVKAIGGYVQIAQHSVDWLHRLREQFDEAYAETASSHEIREALPQLAPPPHRLALSKPAVPLSLPAPDLRELEAKPPEEPDDAARERLAEIRAGLAATLTVGREQLAGRRVPPPPRPKPAPACTEAVLRAMVCEMAQDPLNTPEVIARLLSQHLVSEHQIRAWIAEGEVVAA